MVIILLSLKKCMEFTAYLGQPFPLGSTWDGKGVNFSVYAENATGVDLCLFNSIEEDEEYIKLKMIERSGNVWHIYIPGLKPGQIYGYRVYGSYDPANGARYNPNKLLIDPNAKAITGPIEWDNALF